MENGATAKGTRANREVARNETAQIADSLTFEVVGVCLSYATGLELSKRIRRQLNQAPNAWRLSQAFL